MEFKYKYNKYILTVQGAKILRSFERRSFENKISFHTLRTITCFGTTFTKTTLDKLFRTFCIKNLKEFKEDVHFKLFRYITPEELEEIEIWKQENIKKVKKWEKAHLINKALRGGKKKYN